MKPRAQPPPSVRLRAKAPRTLATVLAVGLFAAITAMPIHSARAADPLSWQELPRLPDPQGFAGPFVGTSGGALIVAGGANFPDGRPWDGAEKVWHDRVFVLPRPDGKWKTGPRLPRPLGYGVSVTTDRGIVCLGGGDANKHYADAFLVQWHDGDLRIRRLPPMPRPAAFSCGAIVGRTIYVAGGLERPDAETAMRTFWALDLSRNRDDLRWQVLPPWPGPGRMLAVAGSADGEFVLFSGTALDPNKPGDFKRVYLRDCYQYTPATNQWKRIADAPRPMVAAPTPAIQLADGRLLILGGDDGKHAARVAELQDDHPGFPTDVWSYRPKTDRWTLAGSFPKDPQRGLWPPVTTSTTWWHGRVVLATGEARPGVRTPQVLWTKPAE